MAATCIATSRQNCWNSGVRATKSVSQSTSTRAPMRPSWWTYASTRPWPVARPWRFSAMAAPRERSSSSAFPSSPPADSMAERTSLIEALVFSRSALMASRLTFLDMAAWLISGRGGGVRRGRVRLSVRRGGGGPLLDFEPAPPGQDALHRERGDEPDGPDRVVVAGDRVGDEVRVGVGVADGDDGDVQPVRLPHRNLLPLDVDDEEAPGQPVHVGQAREVLFQPLKLPGEPLGVLLRDALEEPVLPLLAQDAQAVDIGLDRLEVRHGPAEPPGHHVGHAGALGLGFQNGPGLFLRSQEDHLAARGRHVLKEIAGGLEVLLRLLEVDDVDPRAAAENEPLHLGAEVPPGLQQLPNQICRHAYSFPPNDEASVPPEALDPASMSCSSQNLR